MVYARSRAAFGSEGRETKAQGAIFSPGARGRAAFPGNTAAIVLEAILNRAPTPMARVNPDLPPELERIITEALEKDHKLRYQTAADMRTDLQRLKRDTESVRVAATGAPPGAVVSTAPQIGAKRWKLLVSVVVVVATLAAGVYFYYQRAPKLSQKDIIALADFTNTTGDAVFDPRSVKVSRSSSNNHLSSASCPRSASSRPCA